MGEITERHQVMMDEAELGVVIESLERDLTELPKQIHHAFSRCYREDLKHRLEIVEKLVDRLHSLETSDTARVG